MVHGVHYRHGHLLHILFRYRFYRPIDNKVNLMTHRPLGFFLWIARLICQACREHTQYSITQGSRHPSNLPLVRGNIPTR